MNIYVVAGDSRLVNWIRIVDTECKFNIVRFGQLISACERIDKNLNEIILVDWKSADAAKGINELMPNKLRKIRSRLFICVNDMPLLSPKEAELIRFALLQTGVGGVFSQLSELIVLMPIFIRYSERLNVKSQDPFLLAWDSLPWKKYAAKLEYY
ncbi:MAG: hypothetical protein LBE18_01395 [Planctomycetaceae bacterium]|jgi:hypothetical protein|nr:hypothetical protein [Planctomycetaceae bacterium]